MSVGEWGLEYKMLYFDIYIYIFVFHNTFPRFMSYVDENRDILTRLGWMSDPLLLWEKDIGQKLKPGQLCGKRGKRAAITSVQEVPTG